ncbi:MAG: 4,5-dihydroxyphthalate decarboxylase [Rhodospirillaceae bacterium]|nr:4,5-dihydroxyphthalate decarboxylase [Rhodospirillaceae bacterium]|tara:strand:+ start:1306 stop:2295 length:990 start_codon:yes stop_codon:yes gene_type:complete
MAKLTISLACCDYDRTRAIFDGRVQIEGCEVVCCPMPPEEAFHRAFKYEEFDVTELSFSSYMNVQSRDGSPYIGIPAFISRLFRHSSIYIRKDRDISSPEDLKGKTIGVPEYQMTAAMWVRGILKDEYGINPEDCQWRNGGLEEGGREERAPLHLPSEIDLQSIPKTETLAQHLKQGKLDALISARAPSTYHEDQNIDRLFPHYKKAEQEYYRKTKMFPIMHLVGIRRSLVEQHPWLPVNVYNAFVEAKKICYEEMSEVGHLYQTTPWPVYELEQVRELMGNDHWRYGIDENSAEIDAMTRYSYEQHLSARRLTPADLFAESTFELTKL